jgi:hypothetical protein
MYLAMWSSHLLFAQGGDYPPLRRNRVILAGFYRFGDVPGLP